jgi:nucleoside-diphosphate-sugar epimerase
VKRVLVTGAAGFIGSHCVPLLVEAGYDVHGVVPEGVAPNAENVTWYTADLLEPDRLHGLVTEVRPTHLLHLAWFVAPGEYWRSTENVRWLKAGLDLAREFADAGGERSVMAGTCAEYEASDGPLVEGVTPLRPATLYGACKAALHLSTAQYFVERGVSAAWTHVFYLYGPGENPSRLVPSAIRAFLAGEEFCVAHPNDVRDFLHVEDVARAFVALVRSDAQGDFNIASGVGVSVGELVGQVAEAVRRPELAHCERGVPGSSRIVGTISRLPEETDWEARHTLAEGIEAEVSVAAAMGEDAV